MHVCLDVTLCHRTSYIVHMIRILSAYERKFNLVLVVSSTAMISIMIMP